MEFHLFYELRITPPLYGGFYATLECIHFSKRGELGFVCNVFSQVVE